MADWRAELAVPVGAPSHVSTARFLSRRIFRQWGLRLDDPIVDDTIVILSELLSDAHRRADSGWDVAHVVLSLDADVLTVSVRDRNPAGTSSPAFSADLCDEESLGGDLRLVHGLVADANGHTTVLMDKDGGKTVRVEFTMIK
jgi:hypothetical protein